jgi:hypothetical protein
VADRAPDLHFLDGTVFQLDGRDIIFVPIVFPEIVEPQFHLEGPFFNSLCIFGKKGPGGEDGEGGV